MTLLGEQIVQLIHDEGEEGFRKLRTIVPPSTLDILSPDFSLSKFYDDN